MDATPPLAFGPCTLDPHLRELHLGGQPQDVAPKVFDLLVLLIERRHRIVSKDELQAALWPGQPVTDGAIARTVMQARKAVGDPALIKTVHRVGYRFVGEAVVSAAVARAPATAGAFRLGLLPVANRSGQPHHDWAELGLAAMAIQALDSDARLSVLSLPEMLTALAPLPASASVAERVDAATRLLGLHGCVHAVLRRQGAVLWLDFQGHGEGLAELAGSLRGDDVAELGEGLAREVRAGLVPGGGAAALRVSQDPFIHQAYARAAQLLALHQFRAAAKLLAVVIEFEPESLRARLSHLLALANLEDPACDSLATELAEMAAARGDTRTQAKALGAAAGALALAEGADGLARAAQRLQAALTLAEPHAGEDWAVRLRLVYGWVALLRGDFARAQQLYAYVETATAADNQFQRALALDGRAALEAECGEWLKAQGLLARSAQVYVQHRLHSTAALTLMNLALACTELGQATSALEHARHAESLLDAVQQPHVAATLAESAARVYAELRLPAELGRLLQRLAPLHARGAGRTKGQWHAAHGLLAQAVGDAAAAREHLAQALVLAEAAGSPVRRSRRLQQALELELHADKLAALPPLQARAMALLLAHECTDLRAVLARCEAARALAAGHTEAALAALQLAIETTKPGRVQALSRLDAAWLLADAGRASEAPALLRPLGPWLDEHPLGRALAQRLAQGAPGPVLRRLPSLG
jgi:DNA-binding winged helix-turn-helix (wHTH) protein